MFDKWFIRMRLYECGSRVSQARRWWERTNLALFPFHSHLCRTHPWVLYILLPSTLGEIIFSLLSEYYLWGHTVCSSRNQHWAMFLHQVYLEMSASSVALTHPRWEKQLAGARWHLCVRTLPDAARWGGGKMEARFMGADQCREGRR